MIMTKKIGRFVLYNNKGQYARYRTSERDMFAVALSEDSFLLMNDRNKIYGMLNAKQLRKW